MLIDLLEELKSLEQYINFTGDKIRKLKDQVSCIGAPTGEPVQTSGVGDPTAHLSIKLTDTASELDELLSYRNDLWKLIMKQANELSRPEYAEVIRLKYIEGLSLRAIARVLKRSYPTVQKWHKKALEEGENIVV